MKKGIPREGVTDLGAARLEKENKGKRRSITVDESGNFQYPEELATMTEGEAVVFARTLVERFTDEAVLLADFSMREAPRMASAELTFDPELNKPVLQRMQESLASQREFSKLSATQGLVQVLEKEQKNPGHYYGTVLFATAETLLGRFPQ